MHEQNDYGRITMEGLYNRGGGKAVAQALLASALLGAASLATSTAALAACTGAGAPTNTPTKCLTAVQIPGNPLRSFDISWVNPERGEYYLGDRSNAGIDIIDTRHNTFKRRLGGDDVDARVRAIA